MLHVVRRCRMWVVVVAAAVMLPAGAARADAGGKVVSVEGSTVVAGMPATVEVLVFVPAGADPQALEQQALTAAHATATPPSDVFTTDAAIWGQFSDRGRADGQVVQSYNPAGDPTGGAGLGAVQAAEQTWSSVTGSSFRFSFGGTTTRCPSLVDICRPRLDGHNDVGWVDLGDPYALGETFQVFDPRSGTTTEADVALNSNAAIPWSTDGSGIDVQTVITHEDGHVAGLGHSPDPAAVMYAFGSVGQIKRVLTADDADGLRFLYPEKPVTLVSTRSANGLRVLDELGAGNDRMNDFEPGALSAGGDAAYLTDVPQGEGVFLASRGGVTELARAGGIAGGLPLAQDGTPVTPAMNARGDVAFGFPLASSDSGLGALFRYTAADATTTPVLQPGVTPAPGGGVMTGVIYRTPVSDAGEIAFTAVVDGACCGVFVAAPDGTLASIARPGDPLPGGTNEFAVQPDLNGRGDVAFQAQLVGDAGYSVFLRDAASGAVEPIARFGDVAPGGGTIQGAGASAPHVNARGDVLFAGDLTPPPRNRRSIGLFLHTAAGTIAIARPGDVMPDGSRLLTTGRVPQTMSLSDSGDVAFVANVDSRLVGGNRAETAVYRWSHGELHLVARSGTVIPGIGQILQVQSFAGRLPTGAAIINARGDVLFQALTAAGRQLLLVAGPTS